MADEIVSGAGEGDHIMGMGLDIGPYAAALKEALLQYTVFRKEFSKSLQIRLDPTSLNALSNSFGVQMRQAMQLLKSNQEESVKDSIRNAKKITNAFDESFGLRGFKEMSKTAHEAFKRVEKDASESVSVIRDAAKRAGAAYEQGIGQGADGAKRQLADVAQAQRSQAQAQIELAKGQIDKVARHEKTVAASLARMGTKLGGGAAAERLKQVSRVDESYRAPLATKVIDGQRQAVLDRSAAASNLRDLRSAFNELSVAMNQQGAPLKRTAQLYDGIATTFDKLKAKFTSLSEAAQRRSIDIAAARNRAIHPAELPTEIARGQVTNVPGREATADRFKALESLSRATVAPEDGGKQPLINIRNRQAADMKAAIVQAESEEKGARKQTIAALKGVADDAERQQKGSKKAADDTAAHAMRQENLNRQIVAAQSKQVDYAEGQLAKVLAHNKTTANALARMTSKLGGGAAGDRLREMSRIDEAYDAPKVVKEVGGQKQLFLDRTAAAQNLRDLKAAFNEVSVAMAQQGAPLQRTTQLYENIGATFDRLESKFNSLSAAAKKRSIEILDAKNRAVLKENDGQRSLEGTRGDGSFSNFKTLENLTRTIAPDEDGKQPLIITRRRQIAAIEASIAQADREEKEARKAHIAAIKAADEQEKAARKQTLNAINTVAKETKKTADEAEAHTKRREANNRQILAAQERIRQELEDQRLKAARASNLRVATAFDKLGPAIDRSVKAMPVEPRLIRTVGGERQIYTSNPAIRDLEAIKRLNAEIRREESAYRRQTKQALDDERRRGATGGGGRGGGGRVVGGGGDGPPPDPAAHRDIAKSQGAIASSLGRTVQNALRWLVLYKTIHEVTRLIQGALNNFFREGIEYTKNLEAQQLALRGILAENVKINSINADGSKEQLTGLAALTALQSTSRQQWAQIQQASLAVVGTTSDLMGLYAGILPFATALGGKLEDVQKLTQSTAVAAGLLDISFQDARSAIVSLLQGRALVRNRLVGSLGFTKQEVDSLRGTPKLLELVMGRLDAFALLADEAGTTLSALTESFKDFTGIIASGFTKPLTDGFKQFVLSLTDGSKAWSLFEKTSAGFKIRDNVKSLLAFISRAIGDVVDKFKAFFVAFAGKQGLEGIEGVILAIKEVAFAIETMAEWFIMGTVGIAKFIASYRELIKWLLYTGGAATAVSAVMKLLAAAREGTGVFKLFSGAIAMFAGATTKAEAGSVRLASSVDKVGKKSLLSRIPLAAIGSSFVVTGALTALGYVIERLARVKQEAESADRAIKSVGAADVQGVIQESELLGSKDADVSFEQAERMVISSERATAELKGIYGQDVSDAKAVELARENRRKTTENQKELEKMKMALGADERRLRESFKNLQDPKAIALQTSITEQRGKIGKKEADFRNIKAESDRQDKLLEDIDALAVKGGEVRAALDRASAILTANEKEVGDIAKGETPQVDEFGRTADTGGTFGSKGAAQVKFTRLQVEGAKKTLEEQRKLAELARGVVQTYRNNLDPDIEIQQPEAQPAEIEPFKITADQKLKVIERARDMRLAIMEAENAELREIGSEQAKSDAEMAVAREKLEQDAADAIVAIWQNQSEEYKAELQERARAKKQYSPTQQEETRLQIQGGKDEASDNADRLRLTNRKNAAERRKAFEDELRNVQLELGKRASDVYGFTEESAVAAFDKAIADIRQKLEGLEYTPEQRTRAQAVVKQYETVRPTLSAKAGAEDLIKTSEKRLSSLRTEEDLLLRSFELGETKVADFLSRLTELRNSQTQALRQQASGTRVLLGIQQELATTGVTKEGKQLLASEIAAAEAEAGRLNSQLSEIEASIREINSQAKKVERAFQAWFSLTGKVQEFLSVAEGLNGTNTAIEAMVHGLAGALGIFDKIIASTKAFTEISKEFRSFLTLFKDADGKTGIGSSIGALGGLFKSGLSSVGNLFGIGSRKSLAVENPFTPGVDAGGKAVGAASSAGASFAKALPAIGFGISAALAIGTALFNRAVEKAKKTITKNFDSLAKGLSAGNATLGQSIAAYEKERQNIIRRYSGSKSGRKALEELLPNIDDQIAGMKENAKNIQKAFEDSLRRLKAGTGVFADFARDLMDLEKSIQEYLGTFAKTTRDELARYDEALSNVREYVDLFFMQARAQFQENLLGFESEALASQERLFGLLNSRDGLYKQLRDLSEQRMDLEEAMADEQERRRESQNQLNDLAQKELEIRKRIAEIIRQAAEDEMAIRRRGVLEAQLSVAQQKAIDISNVRNKAQDEITKLKEELAKLQDDIADTSKEDARKDRDFARRQRDIAEREAEIHKELRLTALRIDGAQRVAEIEGEVFGMATDEYDLVVRQNDIAVRQAELQVTKWRETAALVEAIVDMANGVFFEPPAGFPQIRVDLGTIIIDNSDNSTNTFPGTGGGVPDYNRDRNGRPPTGRAVPRVEGGADSFYNVAVDQGYGDVEY
jgi:hypothetical protein